MSPVSPVLPALFQGWTAGAVLYMFVMSGKAWPGQCLSPGRSLFPGQAAFPLKRKP